MCLADLKFEHYLNLNLNDLNKENKFLFHKFRKLKVIYQITPNYNCKPFMIILKSIKQFNLNNVFE